MDHPTPGPQHCPRKNLRELFRGPCALGRPHSQLPPQIARLISTRCPEDQSKKASLIRAGFLCSAAHGGFSIRINDRQTPWPLSCFIFSFSASFSFFSPYSVLPCSYPPEWFSVLKAELCGELLKCTGAGTSCPEVLIDVIWGRPRQQYCQNSFELPLMHSQASELLPGPIVGALCNLFFLILFLNPWSVVDLQTSPSLSHFC